MLAGPRGHEPHSQPCGQSLIGALAHVGCGMIRLSCHSSLDMRHGMAQVLALQIGSYTETTKKAWALGRVLDNRRKELGDLG